LIIDIAVEKRNIFLGDADYVSHSGSKSDQFCLETERTDSGEPVAKGQ
jgi:hypothetical protein